MSPYPVLGHWRITASACDFSNDLDKAISEIVDRAPAAVEEVSSALPKDFQEAVASSIFAGMGKALVRLQTDE
jgi:hypothetical protein